ncbi:MAG: glycosyltransferase [Candidatus Paceibacterota bacterium]
MLSFIIPTYNEEKYIERTLLNLKTLTLPHEVIVTDDKSTDGTVQIAKKNCDLVLVPEAKHISAAANRNAGAKEAEGEFLVFTDSSCIFPNIDKFFGKALANFEADSNLVALIGKIGVWPELETWSDRLVYFFFNWVHHLKNNVFHIGEASGKFQMMRRSTFDKVQGFNPNLVTCEDGDMFSRLAKIGRTMYDPELVILHAGRRAHTIGWPKLLWIWFVERSSYGLTGRSRVKEWKDIR